MRVEGSMKTIDDQPADVVEAIRKVRFGETLSDTERELLARKNRLPSFPRATPSGQRPHHLAQDLEACARKRSWSSESAARSTMPRRASFRWYVYHCTACKKFHIANGGKRSPKAGYKT